MPPGPRRKQPSRVQNRKRKEREGELVKSLDGSLNKYLIKPNESVVEDLDDNCVNETNVEVNIDGDGVNIERDVNVTNEDNTYEPNPDNFDPKNWNTIDQNLIDILVEKGPVRVTDFEFPFDAFDKRFSVMYYTRKLKILEKQDRRWPIYSISLDKVFCFCCKLFKKRENTMKLANNGFNDWNNLTGRLQGHENSQDHLDCLCMWRELELRLRKNATLDKHLQKQIDKEKERWIEIFECIMDGVMYLAKNGLAFRGDSEKIYTKHNGNFLSLMKLIARHNPVLNMHLQHIVKKDIHYHYLSHNIQNEFIKKFANEIKTSIVQKVQKAKYFSIILDCTPDISHKEQMSIVVRCVDVSQVPAKVVEFFLGFLKVNDTTGAGLFAELQDALEKLHLNIDDIRGQGYDNGANMKGKCKGVRKKLIDMNPRAFYTPYGCHSLNLILCDMAKSCEKAGSFFGIVQITYKLFSGSTKRWQLLQKEIGGDGLTLKPLSDTRWESRVESIKAIITQAPKILNAIKRLKRTSDDVSEKCVAEGLIKLHFKNFEFFLGMVIWYDLLSAVNSVSKNMHKVDMHMATAITHIKRLISYFQGYRDTGFESAMKEATNIVISMDIRPKFRETRVRKKKKHFDADPSEEPISLSGEECFRRNYFLYIIDYALRSFEERFAQFREYERIYGFLFDLERLKSMNDEDLLASCNTLEKYLSYGTIFDIDGKELHQELKIIRRMISTDIKKPIEVLHFLQEMEGCYPYAWVAYKILFTVPVTVASAERSFSKLKLIKTYLRSTMLQERLNGLAMISIEREVAELLDYKPIIRDFSSENARRRKFRADH